MTLICTYAFFWDLRKVNITEAIEAVASVASFCESSATRESDSSDSELEQFEDFARRKFAEMVRKYPVLEDKSAPMKMSKIIFNLQSESSDDEFGDCDSVRSINCLHKTAASKLNSPGTVRVGELPTPVGI